MSVQAEGVRGQVAGGEWGVHSHYKAPRGVVWVKRVVLPIVHVLVCRWVEGLKNK